MVDDPNGRSVVVDEPLRMVAELKGVRGSIIVWAYVKGSCVNNQAARGVGDLSRRGGMCDSNTQGCPEQGHPDKSFLRPEAQLCTSAPRHGQVTDGNDTPFLGEGCRKMEEHIARSTVRFACFIPAVLTETHAPILLARVRAQVQGEHSTWLSGLESNTDGVAHLIFVVLKEINVEICRVAFWV